MRVFAESDYTHLKLLEDLRQVLLITGWRAAGMRQGSGRQGSGRQGSGRQGSGRRRQGGGGQSGRSARRRQVSLDTRRGGTFRRRPFLEGCSWTQKSIPPPIPPVGSPAGAACFSGLSAITASVVRN